MPIDQRKVIYANPSYLKRNIAPPLFGITGQLRVKEIKKLIQPRRVITNTQSDNDNVTR